MPLWTDSFSTNEHPVLHYIARFTKSTHDFFTNFEHLVHQLTYILF